MSVAFTILLAYALLQSASVDGVDADNMLDHADEAPLRRQGVASPSEDHGTSRSSSTRANLRSPQQSESTRVATLRLLTAAQVEGGHMVRQLLIDGADVNGTSLTGHTALQLASQHGHSGNVQQLLEYRPDVDAKDKGGYTALMWAADRGHDAVVQQLMDAGASLAESTTDGYTALTLAEEKGRASTVKLLLSHFES